MESSFNDTEASYSAAFSISTCTVRPVRFVWGCTTSLGWQRKISGNPLHAGFSYCGLRIKNFNNLLCMQLCFIQHMLFTPKFDIFLIYRKWWADNPAVLFFGDFSDMKNVTHLIHCWWKQAVHSLCWWLAARFTA